jgi:hypothetical protein
MLALTSEEPSASCARLLQANASLCFKPLDHHIRRFHQCGCGSALLEIEIASSVRGDDAVDLLVADGDDHLG